MVLFCFSIFKTWKYHLHFMNIIKTNYNFFFLISLFSYLYHIFLVISYIHKNSTIIYNLNLQHHIIITFIQSFFLSINDYENPHSSHNIKSFNMPVHPLLCTKSVWYESFFIWKRIIQINCSPFPVNCWKIAQSLLYLNLLPAIKL